MCFPKKKNLIIITQRVVECGMVHCGEYDSKNIIITNLTKKSRVQIRQVREEFFNEGGQDTG
jgi:hypothetical protein